MKKTWIRLISLLIITLFVLTGVVAAQDVNAAEVVFSATEKENDIVELDVIVKNAKFMGIQTALSYDKNVLVPIDENGEKTNDFEMFATCESSVFTSVGLDLDTDGGYFGFTLFIMPGKTGGNVNDKGEYVADETGVTLYKFRFRKTKEASYSFRIVNSKETEYAPAVEDGIYVMDYESGELITKVSFVYDEKEAEQTIITPAEKSDAPVEKEEPKFTSTDRKKDVIMLQIGNRLAVAYNKKVVIDTENDLVVPYITNDRTLVPIRFVAESLGAEVLWETGWKYCIIKKDEREIKLNFNSADFEVNGEKISFDAPVELVQDRTMVPIRFVSEQLDCDVYWNDKNKAVVISPEDNSWQEKREAEITALNEMLITISGMLP